MTTIAITNPSDESAQASIVAEHDVIDADIILELYGSRLEDGAQVVMFDSGGVWQYLATRDPRCDSIALRNNNSLSAELHDDDKTFIDFMNTGGWAYGIIAVRDDMPLADPEPPELHTYTVYGSDDEGDRFVNVCTAPSAEEAATQTRTTVLVDEGYECLVNIDLVLTGDHSDAEATADFDDE